MIERELHLEPQDYSILMDEWYRLSRLREDGSLDTSAFEAWAKGTYGLQDYTHYKIVVNYSGRPLFNRVFDNWPDGHFVKARKPDGQVPSLR